MSKIKVLSRNGDDETPWTAGDEASEEVARALFEMHRRGGSAAFAKNGGAHELIKKFDPAAEEILIVKPLVGG